MHRAVNCANRHAANIGVCLRRIAHLVADRRGVSSVEFALLLPIMMTLYLGSVEASQGIAQNRKVTLAAHALADLASQYTDITDADMANILAAGPAIVTPYSSSGNLQEVVSELAINAQGQATVVWSDTPRRHRAQRRPGGKHPGLARHAQYLSAARRGDTTPTIRPTAM